MQAPGVFLDPSGCNRRRPRILSQPPAVFHHSAIDCWRGRCGGGWEIALGAMEATVFLGHWLRLAEVVETVLTRIPERMVVPAAAVAGAQPVLRPAGMERQGKGTTAAVTEA